MATVVLVRNLAQTLGMDERGLLLLITLFLSYPLAFIYRSLIFRCSPNVHHIFFAATGMAMYYMNFGLEMLHSVTNILLIYLILVVSAGTLFSVITAFILNTGYLVVAYWFIKNDVVDSYEITWTIPHCVLTLRLTAIVWDVYDTYRPRAELSNEQLSCVLAHRPSLLQMFGQCNVLSTFLIGPQFSMKRYLDMTQGKFCDRTTGGPPVNISAGVTRLCVGLGCAAIYQVLTPIFPQSYFNDQFLTDGFLYKCFFLTMWAKVVLYRYVACWIIGEGSLILVGLTHNGQDKNGNDMWDGCANIDIRNYEMCMSLRGVIDSFNVNTNKWMAQYIYKRLKFVGIKAVSTLSTLVYLALWHGLYSGYYHTFALEFFTMAVENKFAPLVSGLRVVRAINSFAVLRIPVVVVHKLLLQLVMAYCLVPFCLLKSAFYWPVYRSLYFFGHYIFGALWLLAFVIPSHPQTARPHTE